ncbi:MAG TPA: hypothetical protein VFQ53_18495 [Kofleriaceae bacterium]|nr:hypothetical protein [Kofleriaceae bacterium]
MKPAAASDLETRVANRKQVLIAEIVEHKMNCSRAGAADAVDRIKSRLSELAYLVKEGVAGNRWDNLGPSTTLKLEEWITR